MDVLTTFQTNITECEAALDENDNSVVLAWDNNLCVGITADGKAFAIGVLHAKQYKIGDQCPTVHNGFGHRALPMLRQTVIQRTIASNKECIEMFKSLS